MDAEFAADLERYLVFTWSKNGSSSCCHGTTNQDTPSMKAMVRIAQDTALISNAKSNQVRKKAMARIYKEHDKYFLDAEGNFTLVNDMYAASTNLLLQHVEPLAQYLCGSAIMFQMDTSMDEKHMNAMLQHHTDLQHAGLSKRGLIRHLAKRVPCKCLRPMKKATKTEDLKVCLVCQTEDDLSNLFVCNVCKQRTYSSKECQKKDWKKHKLACGPMAAIPILFDD